MSAALDLLSALVVDSGRRWGEVAMGWQIEDAEAILAVDSLTPYHFLTRARGGSKTADLAGVALVAMLEQLPAGSRSYALASDRDQGRLLLDSVEGYVERTPELRAAVSVGAWRVTTAAGSALDVLPADAASSWGIRPAFVVCDELAQWGTTAGPRRLFESVASSAAKLPGCRLAIITTAGDPAHWSRRVLEHALRDPLWRVHEVPGPPPWADPERLAEQRRRLPESAYRRLFENEWVASEDRLADPADVAALVTLPGPQEPRPGRRYVVGLDLGLKRDRTAAVVAHAEQNGDGLKVILDRIEVWQGSRERPVEVAVVEEWVEHACHRYGGAKVVCDPWQAVGMMQRLQGRGVQVTEHPFTAQSVARIAIALLDAIRSRRLALYDDADLLDEIANVRLRETSPGVYRIDHDSDRHDDRVIALALAVSALLDRPPGNPDGGRFFSDGGSGIVSAIHGNGAAELLRDGRLTAAHYGDSF